MQSTLKITDPSKYFPWTHPSPRRSPVFFFVSLILRFESIETRREKEFGDTPRHHPSSPSFPIFNHKQDSPKSFSAASMKSHIHAGNNTSVVLILDPVCDIHLSHFHIHLAHGQQNMKKFCTYVNIHN